MLEKRAPRACFSDPALAAEEIIARVGKNIVLGLSNGIGKANAIADALFAKAVKDPSINLRILTGLTIERPRSREEIQRRFLEPLLDRVFGRYPELAYTKPFRAGKLPPNIQVHEFFFQAGGWLRATRAQQDFISANYTHVLGIMLEAGVNVMGQLIAPPQNGDDDLYSCSSNPDVAPTALAARALGKANFIMACQVNSELPFMGGDALLPAHEIDILLQGPDTEFELFSAPRRPISLADQAIGLHASRLVADGGTLQIGIGALGDGVTKGLLLRHQNNAVFRKAVEALGSSQCPQRCHDEPFTEGLYGLSEMFVDGFLRLHRAGILKRKVDGAVLHAGFFLDSRDFYRELREMSEEERSLFQMKPITFTNALYGDEEKKRAARVNASFINAAMMVTMQGAIVSDALDNGAVVSGVGGQFNFAEQAFALEGGRFIITLNATRESKGVAKSTIVSKYAHMTVPWHMRDIVVTEYGIADMRGKTNAEVVAALLNIADSRFQPELLEKAKTAGKIAANYEIPAAHRNNTPERIKAALGGLRRDGTLPAYPFGTDFTPAEQRLIPALELLGKSVASKSAMLSLLRRGLAAPPAAGLQAECMERMGLAKTRGAKQFITSRLLRAALLDTED
jgi:acyl-CoA hydrolase